MAITVSAFPARGALAPVTARCGGSITGTPLLVRADGPSMETLSWITDPQGPMACR